MDDFFRKRGCGATVGRLRASNFAMRSAARWSLLFVLLACGSAAASPRRYVWSYGVETGSDGEVGLELWLTNRIDLHQTSAQGWDLWWGGTGSLSDRLELGVFAVADQELESGLHFDGLHTQLRFRLAQPLAVVTDVVIAPGGKSDNTPGALALLVGRVEAGGFDLTANAGGGYDYTGSGPEIDGSVGASVKTGNYFRVGAEAFMHWFSDPDVLVLYAGPTVELAWGRMWVTANVAFGRASGNAASCSRLIFAIQI
jgi:hypothetical protein